MPLIHIMSTIAKATLLSSILLSASCASSKNIKSIDSCPSLEMKSLPLVESQAMPTSEWQSMTLGSQIEIPFLSGTKYIMDSGPILSVELQEKRITYRMIDGDEIKFIGSDKSPNTYFRDAINTPSGMECAFVEAFRNSDEKWRTTINGLEVYIFSEGDNYKAYLMSPKIDFVTELLVRGASLSELTRLVKNTYIVE